MIRQLIKPRRRRILIDVSTQKDFFLAEGSVCIRNHRRVLVNVRRIMAWARRKNIQIISTCEVYASNSGSEVPYCLDGTEGQKKIRYTLMNSRASFPADGSTDLPRDILRQYRQIILHKRCVDPFDEPRIDRLLSEIQGNEFVIIGACAEGAVKAMVLGLLHRGRKVTVITDAVGSHNIRQAQLAFSKMKAKGAKLVETKKLAGVSRLRHVGICNCPACQGKKANTKITAES